MSSAYDSIVRSIDERASEWAPELALIAAIITHQASVSVPSPQIRITIPIGLLSRIEPGLRSIAEQAAAHPKAQSGEIGAMVTSALFGAAIGRNPPPSGSPSLYGTKYRCMPPGAPLSMNVDRWVSVYATTHARHIPTWSLDYHRIHRIRQTIMRRSIDHERIMQGQTAKDPITRHP